jgi:hypothetical protein
LARAEPQVQPEQPDKHIFPSRFVFRQRLFNPYFIMQVWVATLKLLQRI